MKLFCANYIDQFGEMVMKDDVAGSHSAKRLEILKKVHHWEISIL